MSDEQEGISEPDKRDYEVGYGRPPKNTRFKKGRSGNPKGQRRPKADLKTALLEELEATVTVRENGRHRKLTMSRLIVKRLVAEAAKGDVRARADLLRLLAAFSALDQAPTDQRSDEEDDEKILARLRQRLVEEMKDEP